MLEQFVMRSSLDDHRIIDVPVLGHILSITLCK